MVDKIEQKNLKFIRNGFSRKLSYERQHAAYVERAKFVRNSAGATKNSLYGLFPPHQDVNILVDTARLGKLVSTEKNIDFKYYFDAKGNLLMTERYDPTSQYEDKLVNTVFVEYEKRKINALFCKGRTENIATVAQCKLDLYGRLIRYLECTCGVNGYPYLYTVMRLKHKRGSVKIRHSVYSILQEGDGRKISEKTYLYKKGKLREIQ